MATRVWRGADGKLLAVIEVDTLLDLYEKAYAPAQIEAASVSKPPRRRSKKELQAEELRRSDLTAQLAGRDDEIEYGPHDSLPRGEHIARLSKKDIAQKG